MKNVYIAVSLLCAASVSTGASESLRAPELTYPAFDALLERSRSVETDVKGAPVRTAAGELAAVLDAFLKASERVRAGGARPEMTLRRAIAEFVPHPALLIDGGRRDRFVVDYDTGYRGSFEMRVNIDSRPRGSEAMDVRILLESLAFTAGPGGREYHDGESSSLEIEFAAKRVGGAWAVTPDSIVSKYLEG
jgi:hypothetical protein